MQSGNNPQNILYNNLGKKSIINPDGQGISSERSVTLKMDNGKYINIPTIVDGVQLSIQDAINYSKSSGNNNGVFNTLREASESAEKRSSFLDSMSGGEGKFHRSPASWIPGLFE